MRIESPALRAITSTLPAVITEVTSIITTTICGGCYGVADLTTAIYGYVNSSATSTLTSVFFGDTSFTFANGLPARTSVPITHSIGLGATITVSDQTITSPTGYFIVSAYSVTSVIDNNGTCSINPGPPIQTSLFQYPVMSEQQGVALASAESSFYEQVGLTCSGSSINTSVSTMIFDPSTVTAVVSSSALESTNAAQASSIFSNLVSPTSSTTATAASASSVSTNPALNTQAKIGIGVGIPLGTITVTMLGFYLWRQDRRLSRAGKLSGSSREPESVTNTYLERKAELDAKQTRYQVEANELRREVEAGERHEMEVQEPRHELRAEDHLHELEISICKSLPPEPRV